MGEIPENLLAEDFAHLDRRPNDLDGYEEHLADVAKAWIEDHQAEAVKVLLETGALNRLPCRYCGGRGERHRPGRLGLQLGACPDCHGTGDQEPPAYRPRGAD